LVLFLANATFVLEEHIMSGYEWMGIDFWEESGSGPLRKHGIVTLVASMSKSDRAILWRNLISTDVPEKVLNLVNDRVDPTPNPSTISAVLSLSRLGPNETFGSSYFGRETSCEESRPS
jgi:hypothetical protein